MNVLKAVQNNWKKSVFAFVISGYALNVLKTNIQISQYMKDLSNKIQNLSTVSRSSSKNILVVLNPVANKRRTEKYFQRYCEPILHLTGYKVDIFRTSYIGHAKSFIEEMKELPDVIVVAGGDGTTSEVVTGLMRRHGNLCPLTLLPLGRLSESASKYFDISGKTDLDYIKAITSSLLPLLKNQLKFEHVIQYDVLNKNDNNEDAKRLRPIFGLNRFSWGILKDIDSLKDNYWYFGPLRRYAAALFTLISRKSNFSFETGYEYTPSCPGCSNCNLLEKPTGPLESVEAITGRVFISKLILPKQESTKQKSLIEQNKNDNCNTVFKGRIKVNNLNIACGRNSDNFAELESKFINSLQPGWDFVKIISNICRNDIQPNLVLKSRTIHLYPLAPKTNILYSIDGEEYDPRPIKVSILPNAIKVFC